MGHEERGTRSEEIMSFPWSFNRVVYSINRDFQSRLILLLSDRALRNNQSFHLPYPRFRKSRFRESTSGCSRPSTHSQSLIWRHCESLLECRSIFGLGTRMIPCRVSLAEWTPCQSQLSITCGTAIVVYDDVVFWASTIVDGTDQSSGLILDNPNAEVLVPHSVYSYPALPKPFQDL